MSFYHINVETIQKYKSKKFKFEKITSPVNDFLLHKYINNEKYTSPSNEFQLSPANFF